MTEEGFSSLQAIADSINIPNHQQHFIRDYEKVHRRCFEIYFPMGKLDNVKREINYCYAELKQYPLFTPILTELIQTLEYSLEEKQNV